ncbi:MAG: MFS transporter [Selenomonadaceae bacterium]|nr:MFS transporter [Selenomonadaceae bacterium]
MEKQNVGITPRLAILFSVASGLAVGNLYWAQPLLTVITEDFGAMPSQGGFLVTSTQIGYALGILILVPLGDILERRKLLTVVMALTVFALLCSAFAPSFQMLSLALGFLGTVTVSGQIILPLAGDLADDEDRGRIVGLVTSGITAGILFSRLLSGFVADIWNWRGIYILAAVLNLLMVVALFIWLPKVQPCTKISYPKLLTGVFTAIKRFPVMRNILLKQGMIFGIVFNLFWTASTFLLSAEPFSYTTLQIGLVSLAGLTGALAGAKLGTLQDKGLGQKGITAFIITSGVVMCLGILAKESVIIVLAVAAVFSLAVQGVGILCQAELFSLSDTERSRLNTVFVVSNFLFCAVGSSLAAILWDFGGWDAVMVGAVIASVLALIAHLFGKRSANK